MGFGTVELPFLDHVHRLDAGNEDARAAKGFEPDHQPHDPLARWSCSTMLSRYFDWRSPMSAPESACMPSMAAVLAPLLSTVIVSGTP